MNSILGQRIKELREASGKSLNIFCFENNLLKSTLSNIENGINTNPKLNTLIKIANGLNLTLCELLYDINPVLESSDDLLESELAELEAKVTTNSAILS